MPAHRTTPDTADLDCLGVALRATFPQLGEIVPIRALGSGPIVYVRSTDQAQSSQPCPQAASGPLKLAHRRRCWRRLHLLQIRQNRCRVLATGASVRLQRDPVRPLLMLRLGKRVDYGLDDL